MATIYIKERSKQFIDRIKTMSKAAQISECKKEISFLRTKYELTTLRKNLTQYRKDTKAVGIDLNAHLVIKKSEQTKLETKHKLDKYQENKNRLPITDYQGAINKAKDLLQSDLPKEITLGLCLLTGRRPSEVLKTAKFYNYKRSSNMLLFEGQIKNRDIDKGRFAIYALDNSAKECKEALKKLRGLTDLTKLDLEQVKNRYQPQLQTAVKYHFSKFIGHCPAYDLRRVYACIVGFLYHDQNSPKNRNVFISEIMGHNEGDTSTTKSYDKFYIKTI